MFKQNLYNLYQIFEFNHIIDRILFVFNRILNIAQLKRKIEH